MFSKDSDIYQIIVVVDKKSNRIVGTGKLFMEYQFGKGMYGHIEDIVVDSNYRKIGLGERIMDCLTKMAFLDE